MESKVSQYLWKLRGADSDCPELLRRLSEKRTRKMERGEDLRRPGKNWI